MIPRCLCVVFGEICVVYFESRVRSRNSFPRYQNRGSFSRIEVYFPIVSPVVRIKSECCCVRVFYNNIETSVISEEADV